MKVTTYLNSLETIPNRLSSWTLQDPHLTVPCEDSRSTPMKTARADTAEDSGRAYLLWQSGPLSGRKVAIDRDHFIIGRDRNYCHLLINLCGISRQHAVLKLDEHGSTTIIDLNSTNGTFVNGEQVTQRVLKDGDEIDFGREGFVAFNFHAAAVTGDTAPANSREELPPAPAPTEPEGAADGAVSQADATEYPTALLAATMRWCPYCRKFMRPEARYCTNCGLELQHRAVPQL